MASSLTSVYVGSPRRNSTAHCPHHYHREQDIWKARDVALDSTHELLKRKVDLHAGNLLVTNANASLVRHLIKKRGKLLAVSLTKFGDNISVVPVSSLSTHYIGGIALVAKWSATRTVVVLNAVPRARAAGHYRFTW